jgi:hypothetical protein
LGPSNLAMIKWNGKYKPEHWSTVSWKQRRRQQPWGEMCPWQPVGCSACERWTVFYSSSGATANL